MGAGISEGGPCGTHKGGGRAQGVGRALRPCGQVVGPPGVFSVPEIHKYSIKNHTKFSGHLENFYFWDIFYCTDKSENRRIIIFLLYLFKITESKRWVQ